VGLKPTRGRVSQAPDVGESWAGSSIDGAVTRTVRDAAAVLDAISGYEPGDPYMAPPFARPLRDEVGVPPGRLRIGVFSGAELGDAVHPDCVAGVERAVGLLEGAGHHVEASVPAAMIDPGLVERFITVLAANTAYDLRQFEEILGRPATEDDLEADNLRFAAMGKHVSAEDYVATLDAQHAWSRRMLSWWHPADGSHGFDLLLTPVIAVPPPPIGWLSGPEGGVRVGEIMLFTAQFNVTGQPAISLPLHRTADGLPVGVQLVAGFGREDVLVRVAAQLESAAPWPLIAPCR
jgi:amidase